MEQLSKKYELEPCPFCHSVKAKLEKKSALAGYNGLDMRVNLEAYSVRCNVCHARGPTVSGKIIVGGLLDGCDLPSWATDRATLKRKAAEAWNRRADHGAD